MNRIWIIISIVIVIIAGGYIYKMIYLSPPVVVSDPLAAEVEAIKQDVIKERVIVKEVVRSERKKVAEVVDAMSDDAVAIEWNERLRQYRDGTSGDNTE